ncbi:DUF308 domain-containing protein [Microbacterium album]|uniref:Acyl-CoA synthetase n=1 Tax=Microbacterium album TaxID=2053191 RepID=A0A917IF42_9MICO|nr:DUF308 domain-containing protein [Microbacterium album]GGH42970.1 hypothetical protein GCM10010921_16540 [Microbacterium album]
MPPATASSRLTARHVQLLRALFAAMAAIMIAFSQDHSHDVGLTVFAGFATATALVLGLAAWLVAPAGRRAGLIVLAVVHLVAGAVASIVPPSRTLLFVVVIAWALAAGVTELVAGIAQRRRERGADARDAIAVGALAVLLGIAVLIVPPGYALEYYIEEAGRSFTLTGTTIAVGLLGGYAAIVAVYLGIAGLSPQAPAPSAAAADDVRAGKALQEDHS